MKNNIIKISQPYLMVMPALILIVGIFVGGIFLGFIQSFGYFPLIGLDELTFKYYIEVLTSPTFLKSLGFSLYISFAQAFLSSVLGIFLAIGIVTTIKKDSIINGIYKIPIMIPHTVVALLVFIQLTQSGWLARLLFNFHIIKDMSSFPALVFDQMGIGVVFAYVFKGLPFITLIVIDIVREGYNKYVKVASNLGANKWQVLRHIIFPLTLPSALSGFIILFAYSFGSFEIPYLLGSSTPKALPVEAYIQYNSIDLLDRPKAMVINMIIAFGAFILVSIYQKLYSSLKVKMPGGAL